MKKLVQINSVCNGSTGKIMGEIQRMADNDGYETLSLYGRRNPYKDLNCQRISSKFSVLLHGGLTLLFNNHGMYSYFSTKRLVKKIKKFNPSIIQLHNIHGYYLNYKVLFKYLKNDFNGKIFWTLHDCWTFTGHCAYFDFAKCSKWKSECRNCPQIRKYPTSLFIDTSKREYKRKKRIFNGVNNLVIITPSKWLAKLVNESYLYYPVKVINNGIDLKLFKPTIDKTIIKKYNINKNKKILLSIANIWEERKGLDDLIKLSKDLSSDVNLVLVGLNKHQIKVLPKNIIGIERTDNQIDLIKLYSIADIFINPTKEDNYPTVNIEAIACGTPVITYNTGGCKEQIFENTGYFCNDYKELIERINYCLKIDYKKNFFTNKKCLSKIDSTSKYLEYLKLYKEAVK